MMVMPHHLGHHALFEGVSYDHAGRHVLDDVNWSFAAGEICALVGPNGSGKTTSAWLIARMLDPVSGRVT